MTRKILMLSLLLTLGLSPLSFASTAADSFDEQLRYSEQLFNEGMRTNDPSKVLKAAQIREKLQTAQAATRRFVDTDDNQSLMSSQSGDAGVMTSSDMLKAGEVFGAEWLGFLRKFKRIPIVHVAGEEGGGFWRLSRGSELDFRIQVSAANRVSVAVNSMRSRSHYLVKLQSETGDVICENTQPQMSFHCEFTAAKTGTFDLKIISKGPLVSTMGLVIS